MAEIKLIRADFRLIHGQVVTKWVNQSGADRILIVDDILAKDSFMLEIYKMSAPSGYPVTVYAVEEALDYWKENQLGSGKLFVLIRDIATIYRMFQGGVPVKQLQIGGLGAAPGRIKVYGPITLNDEDAKILKIMQDQGVEVIFHQVPEEPSTTLTKILAKYDFNV